MGLSESTLHQGQLLPNAMNRQMRLRAYGNGGKGADSSVVGGGMPRHETKL